MRFSPKSNSTNALILALFLSILSVISLFLGSKTNVYKWIFQLLFLCLATAAIQFLVKYVLTSYEYVCEDEKLMIYKSVGKRSSMIASLPLSFSESYLMNKVVLKNEEGKYTISERYSFIRNLGTSELYFYISGINGKNSLIILETTKEFAEFVNNAIDSALKGNQK